MVSQSESPAYTRRKFSFGPRETNTVILGLSMGQILSLFAAAFVFTKLMTAGPIGLTVGALIAVVTVALVWIPIGDRTGAEWLPVIAVFSARQALGWTAYRGGPAAVTPSTPGEPPRDDVEPLELPGELAGLAILEVPTSEGVVGVVKDRRRGLFTAILATEGSAFSLLTPQEQDDRVAMWGSTLAGLAYAGAGIVRVQLVESTVPDSGDAMARRWHEHGGHGNEATSASYAELLGQAQPVSQGHETYLAVMLDPRKARRQCRNLGGGDKGACAHLLQQVAQLEEQLVLAGVSPQGVLPPRGIAKVIRTGYEPGARWMIDARGPDFRVGGGVAPAEAGPMAAHADWSYYRSDDTFHALYWISEWPRSEVYATFLESLVLRTACERTISVVMEPIPPRKAAAEIARRRTAKEANEGTRRKYGFFTSARERKEADALATADEQLAAGHAWYRFLGLIRISAPTLELLDQACGQIESRAVGLQLRRLYGEQDSAFPATLPLCRGLRFGLIR